MSTPELITSIDAVREATERARKTGTLALVPTMGAIHDGHLSLVRAARRMCDTVVVSIFVNPTQFGPAEDFSRYPRTLGNDLKMLDGQGAAAVFAPSVEEMYPKDGFGTYIEVPSLGGRLDGASRPGHFRGVATVVAKLLNIVSPDVAFFGQKDAAQVAVLRAMVQDLNFPVKLVVCPTLREVDGLAMSSRNRYLSAHERAHSLVLTRALHAAERKVAEGLCSARELRNLMWKELAEEPAVTVEYVEVVDPDTLVAIDHISEGALLAIAAHIGGTRLIDNLLLAPATESACV